MEAMALHELGVQMYRQRMRRENPQVGQAEIDAMVRAWLGGATHLQEGEVVEENEITGIVNAALRKAVADLDAVNTHWALIGGIAIAARSTPRFTRDLDFAIAVAGDSEAEDVVHRLRSRGYSPRGLIEQDYVEQLSGVRMVRTGSEVIVDLLFASSGIEDETVASADRIEVLPGLVAPVATTTHLIALKVLANRYQDLADLDQLIPAASSADLAGARNAVALIQARGFNRGQDVVADLEQHIARLAH